MTATSTLHALPRVTDSWSFVYVESAHIERHEYAIHVSTDQHTFAPRAWGWIIRCATNGAQEEMQG